MKWSCQDDLIFRKSNVHKWTLFTSVFFFSTWYWPTWFVMCVMSYGLVVSRWKCCWPLTAASSVRVGLGASRVPHICPLLSCPLSTVKEQTHWPNFDLNSHASKFHDCINTNVECELFAGTTAVSEFDLHSSSPHLRSTNHTDDKKSVHRLDRHDKHIAKNSKLLLWQFSQPQFAMTTHTHTFTHTHNAVTAGNNCKISHFSSADKTNTKFDTIFLF